MLPAIALAFEPAERDIMRLPPRSRSEHLVNLKLMLLGYGLFGLIEIAAGFYAYFAILSAGGWQWGQSLSATDTVYLKAVSAFFVAVIICQIANGFISKAGRQSLLKLAPFQTGGLDNRSPFLYFFAGNQYDYRRDDIGSAWKILLLILNGSTLSPE